jgi:hypothetical protein
MAMLSPALKQRIAELRIAGRAGILALLLASVCLVVLPLTFLRAGLDGVLVVLLDGIADRYHAGSG